MVKQRDEESSGVTIDVTYRQSAAEREVVAVLQKLYLCASVEFLMAVGDFFLQALPQSSAPLATSAPSDRLQLRQTTEPRADPKTGKIGTPDPNRRGGGIKYIYCINRNIKRIQKGLVYNCSREPSLHF